MKYADKVRAVGARAGIIGPIVGLAMVLIAIYYAPWFSFSVNALSDLGVNGYSYIFNIGVIASGILAAVFFISLAYLLKKSRIYAILGVIGSISLEMVGIFNETYSVHVLFSLLYFLLIPIAIIGISAIELKHSALLRLYGAAAGIISIIVVGLGIIFLKAELMAGIGFATNELIEVLFLGAWMVLMGIMLLKKKL